MNKSPLTKKQIVNLFKKQKVVIFNSEKVNLENSEDRFLYENIKSKINLPPFNNSAVDGYAILKADLKTKKIFFCNRRIAAGDNKNIKVKPGEAVRIFTGAKMPTNSSTIVMQENTYKKGNKIHLIKIPKFGDNYRLKGEDIKKNQKILEKGSKLNQQNINLIAATGISKIKVFKKIKIGFFTSGNELRKPTKNLKNSEINNSNYYSLNNLLDKNFIEKKYCGNLKDNFKSIKNKIFYSSKKFNVIITAGGASVGDEDHVIKVLSELGKVYFWRAAIKPGRPIAVGKINNCYIICLPGNPVSVQLLYAFKLPSSSKIIVNFSMKKKTKRMEWLRVNKETINNKNIANKFPKQGSGMISSISYSDGIIEIDENVSQVNKGDIFDFYNYESLF